MFGDGFELIVSLAGGFVLVAFSTTTEVTSVYLARWVSPKISVTCIARWNKNLQGGRLCSQIGILTFHSSYSHHIQV